MRPLAIVGPALVLAASLYLVHRALFPPLPAVEPGMAITVESLPRPPGTSGAAIAVAAHGATIATCWEDGSVTIRRGREPSRVAAPAGDDLFRRVAVAGDERVLAITARGRVFEIEPPAATDIRVSTQARSRLAAGPTGVDAWAAGEAGGLFRIDRAAGKAVSVWETGLESVTALFVGKAHVLVGRVSGEVARGSIGSSEAPVTVLKFPGEVTALEEAGAWVVAGDDKGHVRSKRPKTNPSGASAMVEGAVVALALPLPDAEGRGDGAPLLVVHAPANATLFEGGAYERKSSVGLGSSPRAGCALEGGLSIVVGTDDGEKIVRAKAR